MFKRCISKVICGGAVKISTNNRIVSIVDDELDITELFREAICDSIDGISVVTFNDPVIALEHFTNNKKDYALFISDFRMPGINGLELLKRIKSSSPNVRTIIMSAFDIEFDELCRAYSDAGIVDSSIEKPVTIAALCQRVRDEFQVYQLASYVK